MLSLQELKSLYAQEKEEILRDYFTFLRFESIATDPTFRPQVEACATWLENYLKKMGLDVQSWKTNGPPTLFATAPKSKKSQKTLLLYCHYDVQPVDPLSLWTTPPFEPTIREGKIYARGAVDNKGQCFYTMRALKTILEKIEPLNLNIKLLIEGEEESGSVHLTHLLKEKAHELKADSILIVDSGMESLSKPAITLGVRGLVCLTLKLRGSKFDLHSGVHGGIVYNPNRALVEILASLHDREGHVTIPHFYDDIQHLSAEEQKEIDFNFDLKEFESKFEAKATGMEKGFSPLEASWVRPTLEINGISGGYSGAGFKTVIPAEASAKISCRLVPGQDPDTIIKHLKKHLIALTPAGIDMEIEVHPGKARAVRTRAHGKLAKTMTKAYAEIFDKPCGHILSGGSIPIGADLALTAQGEILFIGMGLPEDQIHAPNEHFSLDRLEKGYLMLCRGIELLNGEK